MVLSMEDKVTIVLSLLLDLHRGLFKKELNLHRHSTPMYESNIIF